MVFRLFFFWYLFFFVSQNALSLKSSTDSFIEPMDSGLSAWLNKHVTQDDSISSEQMELKQDLLLSLIQKIHRDELRKSGSFATEALPELQWFEHHLDTPQIQNHTMLPYLAEAIVKNQKDLNGKISSSLFKWSDSYLQQNRNTRTCPQIRSFADQVASLTVFPAQLSDASNILDSIASIPSDTYQKKALEGFLNILPRQQRKNFQSRLQNISENFPYLQRDYDWLSSDKKEKKHFLSEGIALAKQKKCQSSEEEVFSALEKTPLSESYIKYVEEGIETADSCFRRRGYKKRVQFLTRGIKRLSAKTSKNNLAGPGEFFLQMKLGSLRWNANEFDKARHHFQKAVTISQAHELKSLHAQSSFALARVAENEGHPKEAESRYERYIQQFDKNEDYEHALKALVILKAQNKKWHEMKNILDKILETQENVSYDMRDTGIMSFALFWAGRLHWELGHGETAVSLWHKNSEEYFSTFYGGLSHYAYEKASGQRHELYPSLKKDVLVQNSPISEPSGFEISDWYKDIDPVSRKNLIRAQNLLSMGWKEDALCEFSLIPMKEEKPSHQLLKSLFLYAGDQWLKAIQTYAKIPRSFRKELPKGFERILFPKRFSKEIESYAKRLSVDPDLIAALIRQESVFNPKARSHAGARGLMQLMPQTFRGETRYLTKNYLQPNERKYLKDQMKQRAHLFDPKLNLMVGIHHLYRLTDQFDNPVFALSSYNANPKATERWQKSLKTDDLLVFMESIPYKETRAYVKYVLRNYFYYKRWYSQSEDKLFPKHHLMGQLLDKSFEKKLTQIPERNYVH